MTAINRQEPIPPLATYTFDVVGNARRFSPFRLGTAPDPDQAAVRAMNAVAARAAIEIPGTRARRLAVPAALVCAFAVASLLAGAASTARSTDGQGLALLSGCLVGLFVYAIIRQRCIWRHRGVAARTALLELGRCGACGFALRGAKVTLVGGSGTEHALCRCSECGSLWIAEARDYPRHAVTGERADLPEREGFDAARTRMRLRRALRATPGDFMTDAAGESRYIAHMDGVHRSGGTALVRDVMDTTGALFLATIGALALFACCGGPFQVLVGAMLRADPADGISAAMSIGSEAMLSLLISILGTAVAGDHLTRRHRVIQSARFISQHQCPCCTMPLPASDEAGIARCTCCDASWRP